MTGNIKMVFLFLYVPGLGVWTTAEAASLSFFAICLLFFSLIYRAGLWLQILTLPIQHLSPFCGTLQRTEIERKYFNLNKWVTCLRHEDIPHT